MVADDGSEERDIDWYAASIDRAATAESVYSMAHAIHDEVGIALFHNVPADAALELRAVCWAFDYALEFEGNKARLIPRHQYTDHSAPPPAN